ncbi:MAG: thiamine-phosphate kinase [Alphaproteobacteria bacterium]|nr:thiamine-phosphate kinase [Alphaproteobacteria bacterium]
MSRKCGDIGERQLINIITDVLKIEEKDDCAILDLGDKYLVWTTDMLHRETDFPQVATPWQMGWMTSAVNLSDLAAMGAKPFGMLVAAGIPPDSEVDFVVDMFSGMRDCTRKYGTQFLGGDVDSHHELTLSATALGWVEKDLILRRRGAQLGDLLCTTGYLGSAGAGLKRVLEGDDCKSPLVRKLLEPEPCLNEGNALAKTKSITSMMDNSDGLALSLFDLSRASGVGFLVQEDKIPIDPLVRELADSRDDWMELAFHSGGDFGLIFTLKPDMLDLAKNACQFEVIGRVISNGIWAESMGAKRPIEPRGYEHMIHC